MSIMVQRLSDHSSKAQTRGREVSESESERPNGYRYRKETRQDDAASRSDTSRRSWWDQPGGDSGVPDRLFRVHQPECSSGRCGMKLLSNHTPRPRLSENPKGGADTVLLKYSGCTNAGNARPNNEDALLAGTGRDERLFVVADGMGGHEAGEVASFLAVATLERLWPDGSLVGAIRRADRTIFACRADGEFAGMGTTVVALRFREGGSHERAVGYGLEAEVAHVSDSRAYLLRAGHLRRLTEDHSLAAELARSEALASTRV